MEYAKMIDKAVEIALKGHTVELINTGDFINADNKIRFYFKRPEQAIADLKEKLGVNYFYGGYSITNAEGIHAFSQKPDIKEMYKNWREAYYPPDLIDRYKKTRLLEAGDIIREDRIFHKLDSIPSAIKKFIKTPKGKEVILEFIKENNIVDHSLIKEIEEYS